MGRGLSLTRAGLDRLCAEQVKNGHPHRDARLHLIEDDASRAIRDGGVEFDASIDGPGVHNDGVGLGSR